MSLTWPNHVLHRTSRRSGKGTRIRCIGSIFSLLNGKDWSSIKQNVIFEGYRRWWSRWHTNFLVHDFSRFHHNNFRDIISRECIVKDDCIIGWKNWIQKSLAAAKTPNEFNQNRKPNYQERWDPRQGLSEGVRKGFKPRGFGLNPPLNLPLNPPF